MKASIPPRFSMKVKRPPSTYRVSLLELKSTRYVKRIQRFTFHFGQKKPSIWYLIVFSAVIKD